MLLPRLAESKGTFHVEILIVLLDGISCNIYHFIYLIKTVHIHNKLMQ